jgi:hypothetical protein
MEFAESVLLPAAEQFAMVTDSIHRDEDRLLHFFVGCDVSTERSEIIYPNLSCNRRTHTPIYFLIKSQITQRRCSRRRGYMASNEMGRLCNVLGKPEMLEKGYRLVEGRLSKYLEEGRSGLFQGNLPAIV